MHAFDPSPPMGDPLSSFHVPQARASRPPRLVKWLLGCGLVFALLIFALFATCIYVGIRGPDTKVVPGRQVPARFMTQIRDLNLLEPGEQILYFYSDALVNIEEGMYLVTDRRVVVYSRSFEEPAVFVPFSDIVEIDASFSDSWMEDSIITLTLADDSYVMFPVPTEAGGDRKVYETLRRKSRATPQP